MRLIKVTRTNNDLMVHFGHPNASTHVITAGEAMVLVAELQDALEAGGIPRDDSIHPPPLRKIEHFKNEYLGARA